MEQREVKYRAWYINQMLDWEHCMAHLSMHQTFDDQDMILMQYTGLKDKNDTEIYEGDIIKIYRANRFNQQGKQIGKKNRIIGVIFFKEGCFKTKFISTPMTKLLNIKKSIGGGSYILPAIPIDAEVIGNIYENKELLKLKE